MTCDSAKIEYQGDGSTTLFTFPFEYVNTEDVKVYLWNETTFKYVLTTDWSFNSSNNSLVEFNSAPPAPTNPATINNIRIVRETNIDTLKAQFYPGASIKAQDLNDNFEQLQFAVEETRCESDSNFWKKYDDTVHSNETWESSDTQIATTAAIDASFFRQDSSETIFSGAPWSGSDSYIATTAAIDARIVDLVEEVGGFVPIDNETSFPLENPDINDGDGTLISIKEISIDRGIGGGTVTITNGAGTNTVTITGVPTTGMLAGYGAIVETTSTLHTYAFHRLSPPAVEVTTVANNIGDVNTVATNITDVNTVANDITNVNTVATDITNVNTLATNITDVNAVAASIGDVNVVQDNIAAVVTVANDLNEPVSEIDTVANSIANVDIVGNDIANVNTTAGSIGNVNVVASQIGDVNAVAPNITEVTTVAGSIANVNTVATDITNVNAVGPNIANVNTVASNNTNVTTVATNVSDVNTTATNITNVNAVGTNITNVNTVAADLLEPVSEIDTVATNINIIDTVGTDIANVNTVATDITNVNTVATNMSSVNDFAERYRISATAPTTSLDDGDLWWDTTSDTLKVYDATSGNWVTGVTDTAGFLATAGGTMTGALNVTTGTAAGPGLAFDGDTNTGLYSPAADQVALTTGGTGRLFIDASGNVGIGTSSPGVKLHVGSGAALGTPNGAGAAFTPQVFNSQTSGVAGLGVAINDGTKNPRVSFFVNSDQDVWGLSETQSTTPPDFVIINAGTEKLRIDSSGNVGIGTPSPSTKLHLVDASSPTILVQDTTNNVQAVFAALDSFAQAGTGTNHDFRFLTNNTERLRIDSSGRVGIGNSSPTQELCVRSTAGTEADILIEGNNGASGGLTVFHNASDCGLWNSSSTTMRFATNNTERLRIDSSGRVGVGLSSPVGPFHLVGDTSADVAAEYSILNVSDTSDTTKALRLAYDDVNDCGVIAASDRGAGWKNVVIAPSLGNVGIGTTTVNTKTVIQGPDGGNVLHLHGSTGTASRGLRFGLATGTATNDIGVYDAITGTGQHSFRIAGTEAVRIDSSGKLGVGVSSPSNLIQATQNISRSVPPAAGASGHEFALGSLQYGIVAGTTTGGNSYIAATRWDGTATNYNLLLQPNGGSVGIGTASPQRALHIKDSGSSVWLEPDADTETCYYSFVNTSGSIRGFVAYDFATENMFFRTNGAERVRIDGSGNVGIRTSAPSYALDINSGDANAVRIRGTADTPLIMDATDSGPSYVTVQRAGTRVAYYGFGGSGNDFNIFNDTSTGDITFGTNGTERLRIAEAGQIGLGGTNYGTSGQVLTSNGSASAPTWQTAGDLNYAIFQHTTSSGTSAGATSTGQWNVRPINTTAVSQTWASVASNQITLSAGTYSIEWLGIIYRSGMTQSRLRNITDSTTDVLGLSVRSEDGGGGGGFGKVTIASSKTFELQHYTASNDTNGLGSDAGSGENNVFATIKITKHA